MSRGFGAWGRWTPKLRSPDELWRRAIFILLALALVFKGKVLYVLFYTVLFTYVVSRHLAAKSFGAIQCTRHLSAARAFPGEEIAVTLELSNPSRLPVLWVMASDETTHLLSVTSVKKAVLSLAPKQSKRWTYRLAARRRGLHTIGPIHLEAGDALGLIDLRGEASVYSELIVYPKIHALPDLGLPSSLPFGETKAHKRFFADPARTAGTREYQPGDPYKSIHWKVSAKAGVLHVKEYEPTVAVDTTIFLNLNEEEYATQLIEFYSELAIEAAASVANAVVQQRQTVGLVTNGRTGDPLHPDRRPGRSEERAIFIPPRKGNAGLMEILEVLATVACAPGMEFNRLITEVTPRLGWGATLILITPTLTTKFVDTLLRLHRAGFSLIVLIVGFEPPLKEYLHKPLAPGIRIYHVDSQSKLEALAVS